MVKTADMDGSGEIEFGEFLTLVIHERTGDSEQSASINALGDGSSRGALDRVSMKLLRGLSADADASYRRLATDETRQLPMRKLLAALRRSARLKSLILFMTFFLSYISLSTVMLRY